MKILFCDYQIPVPHTYEKKLIEKEIPGAVLKNMYMRAMKRSCMTRLRMQMRS